MAQEGYPSCATRDMRFALKYLLEEAEMDSRARGLAVLNGYALPETLSGCAETLDRYVLPLPGDGVDTYLGFFHAVDNLHKLYAHYFPEEFARSKQSIVPAPEEPYSDREREFFDLVERHLFPLPWFLEDAMDRGERYYDLPLVALGREWWNDGLEDWELGWLLLLRLLDEDNAEDDLRERFPEVAEAILPLPVNTGTIAFGAFAQDCRRAKTPLAYLPDALNILYHDTGSWFLDLYTEQATDSLEWTREDMDLAAVHWRRAIRVSRRADRFITWIDEDPITRFKEVLPLWNRYCQQKQDNQLRLFDLNQPTES